MIWRAPILKAIQYRKSSESHLDLLRTTAALLVLAGHCRILLFRDYPTLVNPSCPLRVLYFLTGLGKTSVMVFFVLSGYLVTSSTLRSIACGRWSLGPYLNQRITRLMVVLFPALVLCWFWDTLGFHLFPHGFYDGSIYTNAISGQLAQRRGLWTFLQNCVFLQGITSKTYGSNDPLWSLSYEFWYYIFLIPVVNAYRLKSLRSVVSSVGLLSVGFWFVGPQIGSYFIIWCLGAAVAFVVHHWPKHLSDKAEAWAAVLLGVVICLVRFRFLAEGFFGDVTIATASAFFIYTSINSARTCRSNLMTRAVQNAAGWSYSLYLFHMPFLIFLSSVFLRGRQWYPDAPHLVWSFLVMSSVIVYVYSLSIVTERHTNTIRLLLNRRLMYLPRFFHLDRAADGSIYPLS